MRQVPLDLPTYGPGIGTEAVDVVAYLNQVISVGVWDGVEIGLGGGDGEFVRGGRNREKAFAVNYLTAWLGLDRLARCRADDSVLVTAAAGGVGTAAVQLARCRGCQVYAAAGSQDKVPLLKRLGATGTAVYGDRTFGKTLSALTDGRGIDVVIEFVGGRVFRECVEQLRPGGRVVVLGYAGLGGSRLNPLSWWRAWRGLPRLGLGDMADRSCGMFSGHLGRLLDRGPEVLDLWQELCAFRDIHELRPVVGHRLPWQQISDAHRLMESRHSSGKIVLTV